jgi:hypothetical protein
MIETKLLFIIAFTTYPGIISKSIARAIGVGLERQLWRRRFGRPDFRYWPIVHLNDR